MASTLKAQLCATLRGQIESGQFSPGSRLPTLRELVAFHGVSEITVRGALRELRDLGLVEMRPRVGTVVLSPETTGFELSGQKTVAMLLPSLCDPFFSRIAHGAEKECAKLGLRLLLVTSDGNHDLEAREVQKLATQVAGLMVFPVAVEATHTYADLSVRGVPLVFLDRAVRGVNAPIVSVDNEHAGFLAGKHLVSLRRPIWVLTGQIGKIAPVDDRLRGFARALQEAGLPFEPSRVLQGEGQDEIIGATLARRVLANSQSKNPIAVLAVNDAMARGIYAALQEAKISIPEHAAIVGFGDTIGPLLDPPLSGVWLGEESWGRVATDCLARLLRGEKNVNAPLFEPRFVTRGSCGDPNFCRMAALLEGVSTTFSPHQPYRLPVPA